MRDVIINRGVHSNAKCWLVRQVSSGLVEFCRTPKRRIFHGRFLRSDDFSVKNGANLRYALRIGFSEIPSVNNGVQADENARKKSFLNYESPALTAELQARRANARTSNSQRPTSNF